MATLLERFTEGQTDLVFALVDAGEPPAALLATCAYFGDASALRHLMRRGAELSALGANFDLSGAAFHGHWRLLRLLMDEGADPAWVDPLTGESALHAALCHAHSPQQQYVVQLLLEAGADANAVTVAGRETGGFMRDVRTRGETPLHRAAAFAGEETIRVLIDAGARREARDANGDSPLGWASWHQRPRPILHALCFGSYRVRLDGAPMSASLVGRPL